MRIGVALLAVFAALGPLPATAAGDVARTRIPTVTRLVKLFTELEEALGAGLASGNVAAVEKMLDDDFELRVGGMPGNPTPRAEWIRRSLATPPSAYATEQMAVHDYGDITVVSFLQAGMTNGRRDPAIDIFTVDVWKRAGESWRLAVRYAGPAGGRNFAIPGASTDTPLRKRY